MTTSRAIFSQLLRKSARKAFKANYIDAPHSFSLGYVVQKRMFKQEMKTPPRNVVKTAHKVALAATPVGKQRMVAIIHDKRYIYSVGIASLKTHPLQQKFGGVDKPYIHAETDAIVSATRKLGASVLPHLSVYIHRVRSNGHTGLAKPCKHCANLLAAFGITNITWSK